MELSQLREQVLDRDPQPAGRAGPLWPTRACGCPPPSTRTGYCRLPDRSLPDFADQISIHLTAAAPAPAQSPPPYIADAASSSREALATAATHAINGTAPAPAVPHPASAAVLALPLHAHDQTLGALVLVRHTDYSAVEHKYLENLAHRLALAYDTPPDTTTSAASP